MTQKELSYIEDAIGHECTIIEYIEKEISNIEDEEIICFLNNKKENHMSRKENLLEILKEKSNE